MKPKKNIATAFVPLILAALFGVLLSANISEAADAPSWWGSSAWWDWSDYRAAIGARAFLARLSSGSLEDPHNPNQNFVRGDLKTDFGMVSDPEPFREFWAEWYIDRLGIRLRVMEENTFQGRLGGTTQADPTARSSELETNTAALGLDLDLIRYPFLRLGIDYDYYFGEIKLQDRRATDPTQWRVFEVAGRQPMTIGVHGLAIPTRIRGVPVFVQARGRFPVPLVQSGKDARLTEWEVSGGLRPSIWDTSVYAHSTFSVALSGGFRSVNLETDVQSRASLNPNGVVVPGRDGTLKARWQGAFIEIGLIF